MAKALKKDRVAAELAAIQESDPDNMLHAATVVAWAKAHKRSALHGEFEWSDSKAAHQHRLQQARQLITLVINQPHVPPQIVSLRWDRPRGGGYRSTSDVLSREELTVRMLDDALADLERVRERHRHLTDLAPVWNELDKLRLRRHPPPTEPLHDMAG